MEQLITFTGGCHCGDVRFEVDVERLEALDCDCSICARKGFLHIIVPPERFRLLTDEAALSTYTFNTGTARHLFCRRCGIHSFYHPRSHPGWFDVNLRCLDGDDTLARFTLTPFEGRRWEENVDRIRSTPPAPPSAEK